MEYNYNNLSRKELIKMLLGRKALILLNLALLAGATKNSKKKDTNNRLELPNFKNICEVKSSIRGRVRFYLPVLKNNRESATLLVEQLNKVDLISHVSANIVTGSLVVNYNSDLLDAKTLQGAIIKILALDEELLQGREPKAKNVINDIGNSLNSSVYDMTNGIIDLKTATGLILVILAFNDLRKAVRNPGYPTLFWWGSHLLLGV